MLAVPFTVVFTCHTPLLRNILNTFSLHVNNGGALKLHARIGVDLGRLGQVRSVGFFAPSDSLHSYLRAHRLRSKMLTRAYVACQTTYAGLTHAWGAGTISLTRA